MLLVFLCDKDLVPPVIPNLTVSWHTFENLKTSLPGQILVIVTCCSPMPLIKPETARHRQTKCYSAGHKQIIHKLTNILFQLLADQSPT